jgi:hypothetical protein
MPCVAHGVPDVCDSNRTTTTAVPVHQPGSSTSLPVCPARQPAATFLSTTHCLPAPAPAPPAAPLTPACSLPSLHSPTCYFMVRWPLWLESWREAYAVKHPLPQVLKDLSVAPFFGNSIACRLQGLQQVRGMDASSRTTS